MSRLPLARWHNPCAIYTHPPVGSSCSIVMQRWFFVPHLVVHEKHSPCMGDHVLEDFFLQVRLNTWPYNTATLFVSSIDKSQITWASRMGIVGCVMKARTSGLPCHQTSPLHFYFVYRIRETKPGGAWWTVLPSYGLAIKYTESYMCCSRTSSPLLSQYGGSW